VFTVNNRFADKVQHALVPAVGYTFVPNISQEDLPSFDTLDSIDEQNLITWSITNIFTSRKSYADPDGNQTQSYRDFALVKLSQSYDLNDEDEDDSHPFSDLLLEIEASPGRPLLFDMDTTWSFNDSEYKTLNLSTTVKDKRDDALYLEYRYNREVSESILSKVDVRLHQNLMAYYAVEKNLLADATLETQVGLTLTRQCWTIDLFRIESDDDTSVSFLVTLNGIGAFGKK
jgi:LPS-assembly protein